MTLSQTHFCPSSSKPPCNHFPIFAPICEKGNDRHFGHERFLRSLELFSFWKKLSKTSFYGFEWAYFRGLKHENGDVVSDSVRFTLPSAVVTPKLYRIGGNNCSHAAQRCHPDFVHSSSSETSRFQFHYSELSLWVKCHPNRPKSDNVFFEKISTKRITLKSFSWIRANLFRIEKN